MLLYTSRKTPVTSQSELQLFPKKANTGSFTDGYPQKTPNVDDDNGEVQDESPPTKEIAPIPLTKSKSRER